MLLLAKVLGVFRDMAGLGGVGWWNTERLTFNTRI